MQPFTAQVVQIIQQIPAGRVMTYGQIAKLAGSPRGARQVARILHSMSQKYHLPWHRVINSAGKISFTEPFYFEEQKGLLELEDVYLRRDGTVDLTRYQHHPD